MTTPSRRLRSSSQGRAPSPSRSLSSACPLQITTPSTYFYAAASPEDALAVHPYYYEYLRPKTPGGRGWIVDPASFAAGTRRGQALMVGSVDQLVEKVLDASQLLGVDRFIGQIDWFIGQIDWGGLPRQLVEESITRRATEIAPQVRAAIGKASPDKASTTA